MNLSFRVSYRDGVMEHEPKACAAVKGTQMISILLECFCIGSMAMPRVWYFVGWFVCLFLLFAFFCWSLWPLLCTSYILSFWSIYCSLYYKNFFLKIPH